MMSEAMQTMSAEMIEAVSLMGTLGFDAEDVRTLFPAAVHFPTEDIERHLQCGQTMHRLNIAARLYAILESPATTPRELIAANQHLREVQSKGPAESGSQELLLLLRNTVPAVPAVGGEVIGYDEDDDEESMD
jgi:hypothetical protein